ncbi:thiamine pyrophosphate-dependent dehydrogenase E1 component subunit alpha [Chloroflexota bacterium]
MKTKIDLYRDMLLIRKFEEHLLDLFSTGKIVGTTHSYIGQEANAVGIFSILTGEEIVFSNHRCHGHYLAYGGDPYLLAAEVMGKVTGVVGGRGGSQHIQFKNFYSNGIQGGIVPIATGMALAEKYRHTQRLTIVFLGDGTLGQGIVYESFNIASLWKIPILFVVENNLYAQTTPVKKAMAGDIQTRFKAFEIDSIEIDTTDVIAIQQAASEAMTRIKEKTSPFGLILKTYRFSAHSKGDDFRDIGEIEKHKKLDPISLYKEKLGKVNFEEIDNEVSKIVKEAFSKADLDSEPGSSELDIILE